RGAGSPGRRRTGADAAAGQVGRARDQEAEGARGAGHPVWPVASGGVRARRRPGHPGPGGDRPDTQPRPSLDSVHGRVRPPFGPVGWPGRVTERASTFARQDVLVALGAGLAGVGRTELEALADRFLAERAVSVVADRALEERHGPCRILDRLPLP